MKSIAKPLKNNLKNKMMFGLDWKDMLVSLILTVVFSVLWIPLMVNGEIWIALGMLGLNIAIAVLAVIKMGEFRVYSYILNICRFAFAKVRNQKLDYVEKISKNIITLKDNSKSCYEFYRILGKDVSLLDENDFNHLAKQLGYLFKDNIDLNLLKIDGNINLNKISEYMRTLDDQPCFKQEINDNITMLNKLKDSYLHSKQPKYFISFKKNNESTDVSEKVKEIKNYLNAAELDLEMVTADEINDISERLYFNNITVDETKKILKIKFNKAIELTEEETKLKNFQVPNETFVFRNNVYWFNENKEWFLFNTNQENPGWIPCNNPFDNLIKKDRYMSFIGIKSLPTTVDGCWLSDIFNTKGLDVNFKVKNLDIRNLEKELTRVIIACENNCERLANSNAVKYRKAENELIGYEELANAIASGEEIKNISCVIKIEHEDSDKVSKMVSWLAKTLRRQGFEFSRLQFNQFDAIKEFFANDTQGVKLAPIECLDNVLGYGYPFTQQELLDDNGLYFGLDENQTPVFIDWKKINQFKNSSSMILLGKTGSGKSTTTKRIIKNQMMSNQYKIFVIDPENEYGEMFKTFGGESITLNDGKTIINPFDLSLKNDANDTEIEDAINTKIAFLETFYRIIFEHKINSENLAWLIQKTAELLSTTNNQKEITFSDVYNYINKWSQEKSGVIEQFGYYTHLNNGNKAYLWDSKTTIDTSNNYICFEFQELLAKSGTSAVGKAQIYLVLQYLNNIILNNRFEDARYINIIIDEAHLLIDSKYQEVVAFVTEMFKRIRKYNGMMTLITQNISDFYKPDIKQYSTALINNAFYIIAHTIKAQEVPMLDELMAEQGGLKSAEKEFLTSANCGKCLLIFNKARTKIAVQK